MIYLLGLMAIVIFVCSILDQMINEYEWRKLVDREW